MYDKIVGIILIVLLLFAMVVLPAYVIFTEIRDAIKEQKKGDLR